MQKKKVYGVVVFFNAGIVTVLPTSFSLEALVIRKGNCMCQLCLKLVVISHYHVDLFSYIDHFYSSGDVCDLTGKPRHVQVRLKYVNNLLVKKKNSSLNFSTNTSNIVFYKIFKVVSSLVR